MGEVLENGVYLPDEGERNAYNGLKGNWNTVDTVVAQVQALSSTGLIRKPVDELPTEDIETNVIYMLKAVKPNGDVYRIEYMYIDNHWDALGTSETTLDDYYTKAETDDLPAVKSGINATRVSNYDTHLANNDIHVTLANKQSWDGKQNALDTAQTAAVNSGVTAAKVTGYDTHVSDTDIHVTTSDKTAWNGKQDGLSQTQLAAVNSGITEAKRTGYDSHVVDTDVHVTTADKAAWNGKQNALTQTQLDNIAAVPDKANSADLATVATTGDYGDLLNAPTIPTVNNAALTIQKNGADVATFTANASSNVTANLAIPVNTSELNNDAGFLTQHNPIDNALSATSENALQNKVVKSELDGKAPLVHTHAASDVTSGTFNIARIPNLDASKITSGTIDIARLPKGALERLVKVANQAARYALTTDDVQLGDTVQQLDTGVMYVVTDETKLDSADGYTEFTAGAASSVPWTGVTGKPNDYPPSSHTHTKSQITDFPAYGTTAGTICEGNDSRLSDARTPVAHTHTKSDVTDLFNSANTWTGNNIYTKYSFMQNLSIEIGNAPSSNTGQEIAFTDKNNTTLSRVFSRNNGDGESYIALNAHNKYLNGTIDPNGTMVESIFYVGIDATGNAYNVHRANTYPEYNNTYDLGKSGKQWKSVYAQSYYYNGVAWGLDKSNVWSATQVIQQQAIDIVNNPSARKEGRSLYFHDGTRFWSELRPVWNTDGSFTMELGLSNYTTGGNQGYWNINANVSKDFRTLNFYTSHGNANLGTSTNKWKTLNGVNPGALSLPDYDNADPINFRQWSTTGTMITYTPTVSGWLQITASGGSGCYITILDSGTNPRAGQRITGDGIDRLFLTYPVVANRTYWIYIVSSAIETARIIPCQGNV